MAEEKPENTEENKTEKKEEKKEKWLNYLAVSTVILAVCATLSTFKGGSYSTKSVLNQSMASDQWSFYQSKSIKSYLYDLQKEKLELDLKSQGNNFSRNLKDEYQKKIDSYDSKVKKYETEKNEISKEAKNFEEKRDEYQLHSKIFGIGVIFLQIAILLSSIAALMKKKSVWITGLALGAIGILYFANGFFLFF